jgi:hypothetical protein
MVSANLAIYEFMNEELMRLLYVFSLTLFSLWGVYTLLHVVAAGVGKHCTPSPWPLPTFPVPNAASC